MIICKQRTHTPPLKLFVKLNFSFEEINFCIYSVVLLLLRRYKALHSCPGMAVGRAVCTANKYSGSTSQTWEHKLYWEDRVKIQTFPEGRRIQGLFPGGAWKPATWPDFSSPGRAGSLGWGQQPQELLFSLAEGKWMQVVQSASGSELLLWPTPRGHGSSLFVSPP